MNVLSKEEISIINEMLQYPWYIRMFGFNKLFEMKVLEEPKLNEEGHWTYPVKLLSYSIYWLIFKLKTVKYDTI